MTSHENFHRMMEGRSPQWMPLDLPVTPPVAEAVKQATGLPTEEAFDTDFRSVAPAIQDDPAQWRQAHEDIGFSYPENTVSGPFGLTWVRPSEESLGKAVHLLEMLHPLSVVEEVAQLEAMPWPDLSDSIHSANLHDNCRKIHELGKVVSGACECTVFEFTWYLRGMDNVFCDWAEGNPVSDWLLDYFANASIQKCTSMVVAGCDLIRLGDDVGTQDRLLLSVEMWRQHLKPRLAKVIEAIREASSDKKVWVQYHSDGEITPLIEELIEIGVDILNPVQPECMDLEAVAHSFGDRLAFSGMIGTQTTMPFGTTDDVEKAVERCWQLHQNGSRVLVAPTHVLEPDVPLRNIQALVHAVKSRSRNS